MLMFGFSQLRKFVQIIQVIHSILLLKYITQRDFVKGQPTSQRLLSS